MAQVVLMNKHDFKKTPEYRANKKFQLLTPEPSRFLMVDGSGDPNSAPEYTNALQTLYPVAYKLKFASKSEGRDYVVPPLEGLWWADDLSSFTSQRNKSSWKWTMMLRVPEWLGDSEFHQALRNASSAGNLPSGPALRLEHFDEGTCVQVLHIGSYDDEGPVIDAMHQEIGTRGWQLTGVHHEIYLSDPRRTAPEKLKTILRQPITRPSAQVSDTKETSQ